MNTLGKLLCGEENSPSSLLFFFDLLCSKTLTCGPDSVSGINWGWTNLYCNSSYGADPVLNGFQLIDCSSTLCLVLRF